MGNIIVKVIANKGKKTYHNQDAVEKVINYVLREDARKQMNVWGCIGTISKDSSEIIKCFKKVKKIHHKTDGVQIKHIIVSFREEPQIPRKKLIKNIMKTAGIFGDKFQTVYALHENTANWHIHFAVNSVGYDGEKINLTKKETKKIKKKIEKIWKEME